MSAYQLRFWFEHGGICIWGMNDKAKADYGYPIRNDMLPISVGLINELNSLENEYGTYLNWDSPSEPSLWTEEHKIDFLKRSTTVCEKLKNELGSDFQIENKVNQCID